MADIEALRLEREEKRRQRRERIRKILEDDDSTPSSRRTGGEADSTRTTRSTGTSRRPRETITSGTSDIGTTRSTRTSRLRESTASSAGSRVRQSTETSTRSARASRLRDDASSTTASGQSAEEISSRSTRSSRLRNTTSSTQSAHGHIYSGETTSRRRPRDDRTTTSNRAVASNSSERSPTHSARTTRSSRLAADSSDEPAMDSGRARREARRRRKQEHDNAQNKITGTVENGTEEDIADHSGVTKVQEDSESALERSKEDSAQKLKESGENAEPSKEFEVNFCRSKIVDSDDEQRKVDESSQNDDQDQNGVIDETSPTEGDTTHKDGSESELQLTDMDKLDGPPEVKELEISDQIVLVEMSEGIIEVGGQIEVEVSQDEPALENEKSESNAEKSITVNLSESKQDGVDGNEKEYDDFKFEAMDVALTQDPSSETDEVAIVDEPKVDANPVEHVLESVEDEPSTKQQADTDNGSLEKVLTEHGIADNGQSEAERIIKEDQSISLPDGASSEIGSTTRDGKDTKSRQSSTKSDISSTKSSESETTTDQLSIMPDEEDSKPIKLSMENDVFSKESEESETKNDYSSTNVVETSSKSTNLSTKRNLSRSKSHESETKNDRLSTKLNETDTKSSKPYTKKDVSRTKSDETSAKTATTRAKSPDSGAKHTEVGAKASRAGKLNVGDDFWKKNVKKKRGVADFDRAVELRVLGRTGKLKDKVKTGESRDIESAEQWKKEVKKGPKKHRSFDDETEKELRELPSKRELKNIVQSCEEKDRESADAWKREVKKNARKHKSLDEDTENELREISKSSALKSRIKECEEKDKESSEAWKKEVKTGSSAKNSDAHTELSDELKEFSGSSRLKDLISSCAERDEKRDKSWEEAKEKQKSQSAEEEAELRELANLSESKSKLIQQYEERDKESAEASKKKIKSGEKEKSYDETTDEELKELAKTVDVKTRIQSRIEEDEKIPETARRSGVPEDEELKEINLKGRLEAYKQESDKHAAEAAKARKSPSKAAKQDKSGTSLSKTETAGRKSPSKSSGRTSPSKDRPLSATAGRSSPTKPDKARTSSSVGDHGGRVSPSKDKARISSTTGDPSGRVSPTKDKTKPKVDSGKTSPTKDSTHTGRISPTKRDAGRASPSKDHTSKRDIQGRISPTKGAHSPAKSKLESLKANLYDGSKTKPKNKRDLDKISKSTSIRDKIAACKERDEAAPRTISLPKTTSKSKPKAEPDRNTLNAGGEDTESGAPVPVNRGGEDFATIEDEIQGASIKDALSFWKEPKNENKADEDSPEGRDSPPKDSERRSPVILGNIKQGWQKKKRKLNAAEFIKELLSSNCKRRDLKDIHDVKSETKKYLAGGMHAEETGTRDEDDVMEEESVAKNVVLENQKNTRKNDAGISDKKTLGEFSFDDVVNPDEVKQLRDFSNFRRQVRPGNRRAAKSNPVRKLQQRDDLKTGTESFNDDVEEEDEEDAPLKPTAIGRLGRAIEPGDRKSKDVNQFSSDALAGLAAKEDVSKITLKKTSKSRSGVSQEKSEHDGSAAVMLLQIKGHRHMQTRLVKPSTESLNSSDSFILVTEKYLYVWNGKDANVMKKSKASELSNKILQYKLLNCSASVVTIIKDGGVNIETGLTRTFWNTLGDKKSVKGSKDVPKDGDYEKAVISCNVVYEVDTSSEPPKLHKMSDLCGKIPKIDMLDSDKAFVFDFGTEVYAWLGRTFPKSGRTNVVNLALDVYKSPFQVHNSLNPIMPNAPKDDADSRQLKRPPWALFGRMTERAETILFEQKFLDWPDVALKMKLDKEKDLLNKNLSKGYAKRMGKLQKEAEFQAIELVSYDGKKMAEKPPPVKLILEGVNVGRGRGSYDEIERRGLTVTTNSVTVYHSSEKESRQLEENEWGHFYSAESYVIRWSYSVKASGIRSLKGGDSKRETAGRDQIAYFFWHGRDCSASGKGTSALATIELDSDKSPQIMVDEGHESACFLNMFDGQMVVHHGKPDDAKSIDEDNVFMYCVHHEDEREISLTQIEARSSNLRSRSSFVVVVIDEAIGICIWHGAKSTKEKREGALRGAKRLAVWFQGMFDTNKVDMVELEEGHEGELFWEALDGKEKYGSLQNVSGKCDYPVRLFTFLSTEGPFLAREIMNPTRGEHVSPYPFRQASLFEATQPALFLIDAVHEMYLWQGWWPGNPEEAESATTTGSAEFRWHRDRRLAMQSVQSYADTVGRQMSKAYVVNAGLEPTEFRAFFPFWEDHPDVTKINFESGKKNGEKESMTALLAKLSRDRYTLAELLVRPLPEGVDPSKMEMYLSDEEFKEVFNTTKDEFTKLPKWKKLEQRKNVGLF